MQLLNDEEYYQVRSTHAVTSCLDILMQPGGASLRLEHLDARAEPIVLMTTEPGGWLQLDLTPSPHLVPALQSGARFFLVGQGGGKLMRSQLLKANECRTMADGRIECFCPYPEYFDVIQRRDTFRAELRLGMEATATLIHGEQSWSGPLKNLSMTGCLVQMPLAAAPMLSALQAEAAPQEKQDRLSVELRFPNDTRFQIDAQLRHQVVDMDERVIRTGLEFVNPTAQQDRELWQFVREIERQASRFMNEDAASFEPSPLFQPRESRAGNGNDRPDLSVVAGRSPGDYPTVTARRLISVAEFLDVQILALRSGGNIDSAQLSRMAERILTLHEENREELLFALSCQSREPAMVGHSIAVAVRLFDVAQTANLPRDTGKAIVACGLVHDLGKALLSPELLRAPVLDARQRRELHSHVSLLKPHLAECRWLSESVVRQVTQQVNERIDGSGYPAGLRDDELGELGRLAAVVDAIDAMGRPRADRAPLPIDRIYRQMEAERQRFDNRWLQRYRSLFGDFPVGTLVRFDSGQLAWVRHLDRQGQVAQVQLTDAAVPPSKQSLGKLVESAHLTRLGAIVEAVTPG